VAHRNVQRVVKVSGLWNAVGRGVPVVGVAVATSHSSKHLLVSRRAGEVSALSHGLLTPVPARRGKLLCPISETYSSKTSETGVLFLKPIPARRGKLLCPISEAHSSKTWKIVLFLKAITVRPGKVASYFRNTFRQGLGMQQSFLTPDLDGQSVSFTPQPLHHPTATE
jgi:hypothetical protein